MSALGDLEHLRLRVKVDGSDLVEEALAGPGTVRVGDLSVEVAETTSGWTWSLAPSGDAPVAVESVALAWDAGAVGADPRFFRQGYQSWSPTSVGRLGVDEDPSRAEGSMSISRGLYHADSRVAPAGELRSELVTLLDCGADGPVLCAGFRSGAEHDGTFRAHLDDGRVTLAAEAHLGCAVMAPGERRDLHAVDLAEGDRAAAPELLEAWASGAGAEGGARVGAPFQVGWCSWYQYFASIDEALIRSNLALAADWPFSVFQLDDGYQAAIGDWLVTNERFPAGLEALAAEINAVGMTPGIWLAPFLVAPSSTVALEHPDWIVPHASGTPLVGMVNDEWGGLVHVLDTTRPEVLAHIEATAAALAVAGYGYLKLDFTYAPALPGRYADTSMTPASRVRRGMEAVRRGAGDAAFLLGCGLPLGAGIGVVDGMRIGPDVAPWWEPQADVAGVPGYDDAQPSTRNAYRNTASRSFMHRRLWLNDPDCLMLRTSDTRLSADAVRGWAMAVAASGGTALASDDLALLGPESRSLLDEVLATARSVDDASRSGPPPRCDDLLDAEVPTTLSSPGRRLVLDPTTGAVVA